MVVLDPVPAYVVKTLDEVRRTKVFINVCTDPKVAPPATLNASDIALQVTQGEDWTVPIVVSIAREAADKKGEPSLVADCCVNPNVVLLGIEDPSVKVLLVETCIEAVEDRHGLVLSRDYKFPRMTSKGPLVKTEFDPNAPQKISDQSQEVKMLEAFDRKPVDTKTLDTNAPKASIMELDSKESAFYMHMYRGPYQGPARPIRVVEVEGVQRGIRLDRDRLEMQGDTLDLGFEPRSYRAFVDQGTTYIMLFK